MKFCATYDYDDWYCWYGEDWLDCNPYHMYISECDSNAITQQFIFERINNRYDFNREVVLIRLALYTNWCWEYNRNTDLVELELCDTNNPRQAWLAKNGAIGQSKNFELVPLISQNQCGTNSFFSLLFRGERNAREVLRVMSLQDDNDNSEDAFFFPILIHSYCIKDRKRFPQS